MNRSPEFAEQYSTAERIRFVAFGTIAGVVLILFVKLWFFPWLREFATSAQCRTVLGSNGAVVLWYGVFVGLPLFAAVVVASTAGRRGFKIIRDGQVPPLGEKAFGKIQIRRGVRAKLVGYLHAIAFIPFIAISLWGSVQAATLSQQAQLKATGCTAINSIKR